jgi:sodium pump decarboxylase gamma subunit
MSFLDTLIYSLIVTLFGMVMVFIVLVMLQYILKLLEVVFYRKKKDNMTANQIVEADASEPVSNISAGETVEEEELIAVITAAVASCLGGKSKIVVRSIRRVNDITPVWARAGRNDQMASRF